jgi:hypothetical protein
VRELDSRLKSVHRTAQQLFPTVTSVHSAAMWKDSDAQHGESAVRPFAPGEQGNRFVAPRIQPADQSREPSAQLVERGAMWKELVATFRELNAQHGESDCPPSELSATDAERNATDA